MCLNNCYLLQKKKKAIYLDADTYVELIYVESRVFY